MIVRVPGSSANLGPGFDTLGMAVALHAEAGVVSDDAPAPERSQLADDHHPATIAFRRAGGQGKLWLRTTLPAARGLGFSGAVRVAGIVSAHVQQHGPDPAALAARRIEVLALAAELEGHADNVAASLLGGVTATAGGHAVRIPMALDAAVVLWVPSFTTRTEQSRTRLAASVPFADAVFNVGHAALLVAALAAGDVAALGAAVADRLHQDARLTAAAPSRVALDAALEHGAWCAWLSGSGPTIAALCDPAEAERIAAALPADGRARVLQIDHAGATIIP
jgi:homoserine kinase